MQNEKLKSNKDIIAKAIIFVLLEFIAILGFQLGNSFILLSVGAVILCLALLIYTLLFNKKDFLNSISSLFVLILPIFLYGFLSALSSFTMSSGFSLSGAGTFLIPFGLICVAACGYLARYTGILKLRTLYIVFFSSVAILTLLNTFATCINFCPFHTLLYKDYFIYYNGMKSDIPISEMAYALLGFQFKEVSILHFSLYPTILLCSIVSLFFITPKKDKTIFILSVLFAGLGLISLLLTVTKFTLITDFAVLVSVIILALFIKFRIKHWFATIPLLTVAGCFFVGLVITLINSQITLPSEMPFNIPLFDYRLTNIQNLIGSNRLLDKIFNSNNIILKVNNIFDQFPIKILGFNIYGSVEPMGNFVVDNFMTSGLIGCILFVIIFVLGLKNFFKIITKTHNEYLLVLVSIPIVLLVYSSLNYDTTPTIFTNSIIPIYFSNVFLFSLFLFGYCKNSFKEESEALENEK